MGAADFMLFALLALGDMWLMFRLRRRRERRVRAERMMRSLRRAVQCELGTRAAADPAPRGLVLREANLAATRA